MRRGVPRRSGGSGTDGCRLGVLDTTDERTIRATTDSLNPHRTLFIVASKSGSTIEVASLERHFFGVDVRTARRKGRFPLRRRHRSWNGAGVAGDRPPLSGHVHQSTGHRRPLFRAVAVRPGAGVTPGPGHRQHSGGARTRMAVRCQRRRRHNPGLASAPSWRSMRPKGGTN